MGRYFCMTIFLYFSVFFVFSSTLFGDGTVSPKCYSGGVGPTPNWDVGCLRDECYHNNRARALNQRKAHGQGVVIKI